MRVKKAGSIVLSAEVSNPIIAPTTANGERRLVLWATTASGVQRLVLWATTANGEQRLVVKRFAPH